MQQIIYHIAQGIIPNILKYHRTESAKRTNKKSGLL